jgi:tyrosinase
MAVIRRNILTNPEVRDAYVRGVLLLKQQETSFLTSAYNIPGTAVPVRTYDLFVIWHHKTMRTPVPPDGDSGTRNAAHRGPVFLPWHRLMLRFMELNLQRVLEDPTFGLPYWDWTVDGSPAADGSPPAPASSLIWDKKWMGGQGDPVNIGPFAFDAGFRVRIESDVGLALRQVDRGLRRSFGQPPPVGSPTLPSGDDLRAAFDTQATPDLATYDVPPWDKSSGGFRNRLEGFKGTGLHNQVHRWVNGDMAPAHSPNDPVFFLHHCNVDRIWEGWMRRHGRVYLPDMTESDTLKGHRIDDPIVSPLGKDGTPDSVLDQTAEVTYDGLP